MAAVTEGMRAKVRFGGAGREQCGGVLIVKPVVGTRALQHTRDKHAHVITNASSKPPFQASPAD